MKPRFVLPLLALSLLASCERSSPTINAEDERRRAEEVRALDDRIARLQELEDRLAARDAAETDAERAKLLQEKERLEAERDALADSRDEANAEAARAKREARNAAERAEQAAARADNERADAQLDFFYTALEPHGEWLEVDGLGFCWQPVVAERRDWRPYTDGRWVFTEYGWTWKSNEPFGWATYHYGRWTKLQRIGWIWVPATEWGPAWVSWRRSDDFIGWAPLPPDAWSANGFTAAVDSYYDIGPGSYTFVPAEALGAETYVGQVVEPEQNVTIINKTVNITNVTYKTVKNVTVVYNAGPDLERVNRRSRSKIPQLKVERVAELKAGSRAATQQEGVLRMMAPRLERSKGQGAPPKRVKERVKGEPADRGWSEISDRKVLDQVRDRNRQEARQAETRQRTGRRDEAPAAAPATPVPVVPKATPRPSRQEQNDRPRAGKPAPSTPVATPVAAPRERPATRDNREEPKRAVPAEAQPDAPQRPAEPASTADDGPRERGSGNSRRSQRDENRKDEEPAAIPGLDAPARMNRPVRRDRPASAATPIPATAPGEAKSGSPAPETEDTASKQKDPETGAEPPVPTDASKAEAEAPAGRNGGNRRMRIRPEADPKAAPATPAPRESSRPATPESPAPERVPETAPETEIPATTQQSPEAPAAPVAGEPERRRPRAERVRSGNRAEQGRAAERVEGR